MRYKRCREICDAINESNFDQFELYKLYNHGTEKAHFLCKLIPEIKLRTLAFKHSRTIRASSAIIKKGKIECYRPKSTLR